MIHIATLLYSKPDKSIEYAITEFQSKLLEKINQESQQTYKNHLKTSFSDESIIENISELNTKLENLCKNIEAQNQMLNNFHLKTIQMNKDQKQAETRINDFKNWLKNLGKKSPTIKSCIKEVGDVEKKENEKGNYVDIWSADKSTIEALEPSYSKLSLYLEFLNNTQK